MSFAYCRPDRTAYNVFLSIRCEGSRDSFTNELHNRMRERQIKPFIDDRRLQRGDEISPAALKAIEESPTSVVIFSKDYASSKCCLNELAQIMECRKKNNQTVMPVFNDISPSDVRNQTGPFADAFKNHEAHKSVQKWKDALNEAANIPGYDLQEFKSEAALSQVLVDDILKKLDQEAIHEPKPSSSNIIKQDSGHKDEGAPPDDNEEIREQDKGDEDKEPKHTSSNIGDQDRGDEEHDVYLSFRGEDTRHSFTSHFYDVLRENKISTFNDDGLLRRGDEISPALLKAIEGSRISLINFSKDYAGSRLCLDELVKILECREKYNQIVIPVYYDIDPSDVKNQTGPFADAFKNHEAHKSVQKWRDALRQAANLPDFYNLSEFKSEAELTQHLIKIVFWKLRPVHIGDILERYTVSKNEDAFDDDMGNFVKRNYSGHKDEEIHDPKRFQWSTAERMFAAANLVLEVPSVVFDELSSVHKPQYELASMLMSLMAILFCIIQLVYQGRKGRVGWKRREKKLWLYYPNYKPFGTVTDFIGLICAIFQSIFTAVNYASYLRNINDPIKISIWPLVFSFCLVCSTFSKESQNIDASTGSAVRRVNNV